MAHLSSTRISYTITLSLLFAIILITLNFPDVIFAQAWVPLIAVGAAVALMINARKQGRTLMRSEGYDSIWEFRWFFLGFWILMLIAAIVFAILRPFAADIIWAIIIAIIVAANAAGIAWHRSSRAKLVRNVKKEELFQ